MERLAAKEIVECADKLRTQARQLEYSVGYLHDMPLIKALWEKEGWCDADFYIAGVPECEGVYLRGTLYVHPDYNNISSPEHEARDKQVYDWTYALIDKLVLPENISPSDEAYKVHADQAATSHWLRWRSGRWEPIQGPDLDPWLGKPLTKEEQKAADAVSDPQSKVEEF